MFIIRSTRVVLPGGECAATIHIDRGTIIAVGEHGDIAVDAEVLDVGDLVVSPGIVDTHVHVNEPGRADWEGFDTATRAAAAGGVTTIVDMPLNSIPATTTVDALEAKRRAARGQCHVDVGFWGGVVPGNATHLEPLVDAGVRGFKCFLVPSGVDEFPAVGEDDLRVAMPILARRGVPLLVHAESPTVIEGSNPQSNPQSATRNPQYIIYLSSRPPAAEVEAIRLIVALAREFGTRSHIVHVASAEAVDEIEQAKSHGIPITAETCPHYLTFAAEDIADGATEFKCAPPIRESRHRQALWRGLERGVLDLIATDHSPAPPHMKCPGDFTRAWGGIASLELALSAIFSHLRTSGAPAGQATELLAYWMSERPARLAGLADRKGHIAPGYDADIVVWNPDEEFTVDPFRLQQRHKLTPYAGRRMHGRVLTTFLGGARVWDGGDIVQNPSGRFV